MLYIAFKKRYNPTKQEEPVNSAVAESDEHKRITPTQHKNMADSSQKFIGRNRAPRVQIEYDVELYGAEKKVDLPFVMGVVSDLTGKVDPDDPPAGKNGFLEIDSDNFSDRMESMKPRTAFSVPNVLSGEGNVAVDLTFKNMDDFAPDAVAARIPGVAELLEARKQLASLLSYMDGKAGAEELIGKILKDPALLKTLSEQAAKDKEAKETAEENPENA